ncbi:hypothetical protein M758_6G155000 [Ceratodon purpureus]|nr:hypothetical protein M758_6G155000 [Ceratodon purpureus]KAG0614153.1 hypothetical protein M758_6G155000 [Ceratodon purpureus]
MTPKAVTPKAMTPNGTRRRSARLSLKSEAIDEEVQLEEPPRKRARRCLDNGTENKDDAPVKNELSNGIIKISASQSQCTKEGENGEGNGNYEAIDKVVGKVEAPGIPGTKEVTAEGENKITGGKSRDETIKEPLMVEGGIDCNKGSDSVTKEGAEKPSGEDTSKLKEVEPPQERNGNGTSKATLLRSGSGGDNLLLSSSSPCSWDPTEGAHILAVKKALHLSAIPSSVICRDNEQEKVISFCKSSILQQVPGSMYVCGVPGTGKSLTMEQVKLRSVTWAAEANLPPPDIVSVNCTTLTDPRNIYQKVLQALKQKEASEDAGKSWSVCLKELKQRVCDTSRRPAESPKRMLLMIVDEMDYLISRNQEVLYDLFQLATYPNSCCILMGIANAIDLTDRFLPKLRSMNCKPDVITYPAYTKDQISAVLTQRLKDIPFTVFHTAALELCARKVAAASGDMRKALHVCRSALDILETEVRAEMNKDEVGTSTSNGSEPSGLQQRSSSIKPPHLVRIDHMAKALARTFRSPVVETIQNLPQHQQMVLCSAVRLFRRARKDATLGELNKAYLDFCKSSSMPALAGSEFSSMCRVLADQALLKLGESREDRLRRVTLQVNQDDVVFALQGVRFFRNSLS